MSCPGSHSYSICVHFRSLCHISQSAIQKYSWTLQYIPVFSHSLTLPFSLTLVHLLILIFLPWATNTACYYNNKWIFRIIITSEKKERENDKLAFTVYIGKVATNTLLKASGTSPHTFIKSKYRVRFAYKTREHHRCYSRYCYLHAFMQCVSCVSVCVRIIHTD